MTLSKDQHISITLRQVLNMFFTHYPLDFSTKQPFENLLEECRTMEYGDFFICLCDKYGIEGRRPKEEVRKLTHPLEEAKKQWLKFSIEAQKSNLSPEIEGEILCKNFLELVNILYLLQGNLNKKHKSTHKSK